MPKDIRKIIFEIVGRSHIGMTPDKIAKDAWGELYAIDPNDGAQYAPGLMGLVVQDLINEGHLVSGVSGVRPGRYVVRAKPVTHRRA